VLVRSDTPKRLPHKRRIYERHDHKCSSLRFVVYLFQHKWNKRWVTLMQDLSAFRSPKISFTKPFCVFMDRAEVEVHKHAKKERGQYPAILTERTTGAL